MVNMPINVSAFPKDELDLVTDINQNINQEYYEWLLKQHNYFPDCAFHKEKFEDTIKMEHSYTRDWKPTVNSDVMATRTILVERPPLCPSCHQLPPNHDEKVDTPEVYNIPIPTYNEEAGRQALNATEDMIKSCHNHNSDMDDWTESIAKDKFTDQQLGLFERVERILDMDQLGRLAVTGLPNECLRRNAIIEKSVSRMRAALSSVHWDVKLTSWLHHLLMAHLPQNYMVSYIDILQTLKRKIPALVDKMLYPKPVEMHKEYVSAIMKKPWTPAMVTKTRTLPSNPIIVVISSAVCSTTILLRDKRWLELLSTLSSVESVMVKSQAFQPQKTIEELTEHLVALARAKIQEIRNQTPNRHVILAGINAGASIALQVALIEPVNSIVCLGFAYNTLNGTRGALGDRIFDLNTPVLFVVGQNAQRSSQEEIESLRLKMPAQTLLVVVGSSDDSLRVKRLNRSMEGVSQLMIDNMIMDEIQEFTTNCILNPPGPRKLKDLNGYRKASKHRMQPAENGRPAKKGRLNDAIVNGTMRKKSLVNGRNNIRKKPIEMDEAALKLAVESVLPPDVLQNGTKISEKSKEIHVTPPTPNVSPSFKQKVKYIPTEQFVHLKPPKNGTQKIYVKQQNGNQTYTLGVKNISSSNIIPTVHDTLMEPTNVTSNGKKDEEIETDEEDASQSAAKEEEEEEEEEDASMGNFDIFDIPILFADDGNTADELETSNDDSQKKMETTHQPQPKSKSPQLPKSSLKTIKILSDTVIKRPTNGDSPIKIQPYNEKTIESDCTEKPSVKLRNSKPHSNGSFVVLNKTALNQVKDNIKRVPNGKIKKFYIPRNTGIRQTFGNSNGLSSLHLKNDRQSSGVKMNVTKIHSVTRPTTTTPLNSQTNGRPSSPKSGILIKRNHLKNIKEREKYEKANNATAIEKQGHTNGHDSTSTTNNHQNESLKNLIAELEN